MTRQTPAPAARPADHEPMARALRLARRGLYTTGTNPRVGAVLVRDGVMVGEAWHRRVGEPHAEPLALAAAGERARGATLYVTLEPCCHQGRTPPCTEAVIAAGVARVVCAMIDPNPLVAGQGVARLRAAGLEVQVGPLTDAARDLNPGFIKRMERALPYCRCKLAASIDGRTAMASGESRWISSVASRADVQRLRARHGAILTGVLTLLADDPSLNVRLAPADLPGLPAGAPVPQPWRVVADSALRTPPGARLLGLPGTTVIACCAPAGSARAAALEAAGARVVPLPERHGRLDLRALMAWLAGEGINEVLLEAGPTLAGAALTDGLIDELILYVAPHLMGDGGRGLLRLPGLTRMEHRIPLRIAEARRIGPDLRLTLRAGVLGGDGDFDYDYDNDNDNDNDEKGLVSGSI